MKDLRIGFAISGILFLLTSCTDHLEQKPAVEEIVGKWDVNWVADSVKKWLSNNGIHELPAKSGIELLADGTFVSTSLPYAYERRDSVDKCLTINQGGRWKLVDDTNDHDLVKWKIEIRPNELKLICRFNLHKDSRGIYLDNPVDWELPKSVELRKPR